MAGWSRSTAYYVDHSVMRSLVGVCNKAPQGGALGRQIADVVERAGEQTAVIVRSTDFPSNPKAAVSRQIGELITRGGRRVVVQDSDMAHDDGAGKFRHDYGSDPSFAAWLEQTRPLTSLSSVRAILGLDHHNEPRRQASPFHHKQFVPRQRPR